MSDKSLTFNLFGKDVSASKAVGEFQSNASGHVHGLVKDLAGLAAGFVTVSAVIDFGKRAVEAASVAQTANEKLSVALKNTHSGFKATSDEVMKQKEHLANYGFTGAQVADALTVMTTGLGDGTKALGLLQLSADLARYKNIGLADAALVVTKGMEGQVRPLKQLGIDLPVYAGNAQAVAVAQKKLGDAQGALNDLLAKSPDAANVASKAHGAYEAAVKKVAAAQDTVNAKSSSGQQIIDALSQKLSGQASKAADTYAGKQDAMAAKFDDLQVKVGTVLLPALSDTVTGLDNVFTAMDDVANAKSLPDMFDRLANHAQQSSDAQILAWTKQNISMVTSIAQTQQAIGIYWGKEASDFQALTAGWRAQWATFVGGWGNGLSQINSGWGGLMGGFNNGWAQITGAFARGADQIGKTISNMWSKLLGAFANGWAQIQGFLTGHPFTASGTVNVTQRVTTATSTAAGLASGGVVRARPGGTPAIIGEGGHDEMVLPLTSAVFSELAKAIGGGGGGGTGFRDLIINEVTDTVGTAHAVMRHLNLRAAV